MNVSDVFDVWAERRHAEREAVKDRERQIFLNKCLREIDGEDAYRYLVHKASKILNCSTGECLYAVVNYFIDNREHFDCSFEVWLEADNGPLVRHGINGLFPEFELVTDNKYEIAKLAKEAYGVEIEFDWEGRYIYSLEFNFKEINSKRVNLKSIREEIKSKIMEAI